ncbi:hypothetical protein EWM17_19705, partial [Clostridioides difficile]
GETIPHFFTAGASSAFFGFTGCGISIGCVIACMLSKNASYKNIVHIAKLSARTDHGLSILPTNGDKN